MSIKISGQNEKHLREKNAICCQYKETFQENRLYENKWELEVNSFIGLHSAKRDYTMTKSNDDCTAV